MVKNTPCNARDTDLIPDWGTKIPHATQQLHLYAPTIELMPQLESPCAMMKDPS